MGVVDVDATLIHHARPAMTTSLRYGRTDLELVSSMNPEPSAVVKKLAAHASYRLLVSPLRCNRLMAGAMA